MYINQYVSRNRKLESLGISYSQYLRSPTWFLIKKVAAREERFQKCFVCNSGENLQLHHKRYGDINKIAKIYLQLRNLVALCGEHHLKVHEYSKKHGIGLSRAVLKVKMSYRRKIYTGTH